MEMYKCDDCGAVFDLPKRVVERHGFDYGPGEGRSVCPSCGGGVYQTEQCLLCGEEFEEDELCGAFCRGCLRQSITYASFLQFSDETQDQYSAYLPDAVQRFMFEVLFGIDNMTDSSPALRQEMRELYLRKVAHEKLVGGETLLGMIRDHVMDDMTIRDEYATWLASEEVVCGESGDRLSNLRHGF